MIEPERQGNLRGRQIGMVAQDVEPVIPEWVGTGPHGYKELTMAGFEALAVEALRDLKGENDALQARNRALEVRMLELETRLAGNA